MRDLPKIVGDTPIGKDVPVLIIRKGKEADQDRDGSDASRIRRSPSPRRAMRRRPTSRWYRRRSASTSRT